MTDLSYKQRINRAIKSATSLLNKPEFGAQVIILNNHIFHIEAIREKEIRKIRIVLDEIKEKDINLVRDFKLPSNCTKEIWCRQRNQKNFIIKEIS